ncbi:MAG: type 4a pilus biogenesis protein PilO [Elusimicrobia bacterium]|nr:type 4a pilus biogenesis protein PilO [Elusimicrobiota bacterium]
MGALVADLFARLLAFFKDMAADITIIYADKGIEPFKKPLLFALPALLIIYSAVYGPLSSKVDSRSAELIKFEAITQNYQEYTDARTKLLTYQTKLPLLKDKDEWLNHIITTTAQKNGLVFDSLTAQTETEISGFLVVSRGVTVTTSYAKLGAWLADIENSPILLKVTEMSFQKQDGSVGVIQAKFTLSTIFPRFGGVGAPGGGV